MKKIKDLKKLFFLCCVFLFLFIFKTAQTDSILEIKKDDLVLGDIKSPITIIEYASLSCIHCSNFHKNTLPKIIEEYINTGKAKIIFRHFPLNYPALMGSMIVQCIDNNIRYDYLSALFELQSNWVKPEVEKVKKELFKIMQTGGMNKEQFNECINDKNLEEKILQGLINAQNEFNIRTTPSFIINGTLLEGNKSYKDFIKIFKNIE